MMAVTLTDKEKADILAQCKNVLVSAGFDNVVILATYFMDDCMSRMVTNDSIGKDLWDPLCHSVLASIVPEIRKTENTMKD